MKDKGSQRKKVVFFIGGLNFGGMERVIFIAKDLLDKLYDIEIVTLYQTQADYEVKEEYYNLNVPPSSRKLSVFFKRFVRTIKMKKKIKPDIVFSFGMYLNYLNVLSNFFVRNKPTTIIGIRSYDWLTDPFLKEGTDRWIIQQADKVNSVSKLIARDAERVWRIPLDKNQVIYNPYDVDYLKQISKEEIDDFEFDSSKYYFITMGRLSDQKGYGHLIRAFAGMVEQYKDVKLVILGNGDRKEDLEKMIQQYDLERFVDLPGGKVNPHRYVRRANVYVMSSITEGFPNALSEAMCVGTPVISVNCKSGPSEILFDSLEDVDAKNSFVIADYGLLTKELEMDKQYIKKELSDEERSLMDAMIYAYENQDEMMVLAKKAQNRMRQFDYDRFKHSFIKALEE